MLSPRAGILLLALLAALPTLGCQSQKTYDDPIAKLMDRTEGHRTRWAAARQAEEEMRDDPRRIDALKRLIWERGYPHEYAEYAIAQLLALDEQMTKDYLASSIVLIKDWLTLNHVIDTAVERNWTDFVPALVRSYAQTTPVYRDADRPERKAIEKLAPGQTVEAVVLNVFADQTQAHITQRAAAWQLTYRLAGGRDNVVRLLADVQSQDSLVLDLKAGADQLRVVPSNLETVTWLRTLRTEPYVNYWNAARAAAAQLTDEQASNLQLRHLPVLTYLYQTQPDLLTRTRAQLLDELFRHLATQEHHLKGPTYDGPMATHPQQLSDWHKQLAWGDLLVIRFMTQLMLDRRVVAQWFEQATADHHDKSTEYGGLIRLDDAARPYAHLYKPMMRRHDLIYYAPKELVIDAYTSFAHYHFHAQSFRNSRFAGPGRGDLERIAGRQQFNALVLTFIDENRLNVDYYQPGEVVVDLGTVRR